MQETDAQLLWKLGVNYCPQIVPPYCRFYHLGDGAPKYTGIGRLMIAYGIKLSIDNGFAGDVVLEAKTTSLARHYEKDFGAIRLPAFGSSAPRYLIADEAAKQIFFTYLALA